MQNLYQAWSTAPFIPMTDVAEALTLQKQSAWATAEQGGNYTASETNGVVSVTNNGTEVNIPVTVPPGTTVNGGAFGQSYGGDLSDWVNLGTGATETLNENVAPTITSAASATSIVGAPFSFTVTTTGAPTATLTETGALPSGINFIDNGNGTATIAGTAASGTGGSFPITITATNANGAVSQSFTLTNAEAPTITSPSTATFTTGVAGTYKVTTTGSPAPSLTESGTLPAGMSFTDNKDGTGTITGTPADGSAGTYPVSISATNVSGSTATLALTITVNAAAAPTLTSVQPPTSPRTRRVASPSPRPASPTATITESGTVPDGLTFTDNGDGTATLSGTPTAAGPTNLTITASNGIDPDATQTMAVVVGTGPTFTSADSQTATVGTGFSFTVTTSRLASAELRLGQRAAGHDLHRQWRRHGHASPARRRRPVRMPWTCPPVSVYGTAQQTLTVTVQQAPSITSGAPRRSPRARPGRSRWRPPVPRPRPSQNPGPCPRV